MTRQASRSMHVGFYHKPQDGQTPIFDSASNKWTYKDKPTSAQITASVSKLDAVEAKASSAMSKAEVSEVKAVQAQATADSKVTAEEAVSEVRAQIFDVVPLESGAGGWEFVSPAVIQFLEVGDSHASSTFEIRVILDPSAPPTSATHKWLNYVTIDNYNLDMKDLLKRIEAIEKKLGIS